MLLKDYMPSVSKSQSKIFISGISFDSSKVKKNNIFFAIKGGKFDGNNYISEAIKKGAKVIVSEKKFNPKSTKVIFLYTSNTRKLLSQVSYKVLKRKPKKNSSNYWYQRKIINCRFLLSNIKFEFKESCIDWNYWY